MLYTGAVLVWEWQDEGSLWKPYSPQVAHYIEKVLRENPRASSISLGEADASLTPYILDLISMNQFRLDTGTLYPVRRVNFPLSTAPGQCIVWEWEELPGQWVPFETRISVLIQNALEKQHSGVRLGEPCTGSNICFRTMTQIKFPSQRRFRIRARNQMSYPTVNSKHLLATFQTALPQHRSGNLNSKPLLFNTCGNPVNSSQRLLNSNQGLKNSNIGLVNFDQSISSCSQGLVNIDQGLINVNDRLVNANKGIIHSNQLFVNSNQLMMNSHQMTTNSRYNPVNTNFEMTESKHTIGKSDNKMMNSNQILMNINSGVVNFSTEPFNLNRESVNSNEVLVDYNQDVDNTSNELINFEATVVSPNYTPYMKSNAQNPEPGNSTQMLLDSDIGPTNTSQQLAQIYTDSSFDHSNPAMVCFVSRQADSGTGLARKDLKYDVLRSDLVNSESAADCIVLNRSNSRCDDCRSRIYIADSRSVEGRPEMFRSNENKPEFVRSNSRPSDSRPCFVRADSKSGFTRPDLGQAEFMASLARSNSQDEDTGPVFYKPDCRNGSSRPGFVRSISRPVDPNPELISKSSDSNPGLSSYHSGLNQLKSGPTSRGLSRSASLRLNRSPPPCTCPQCFLVQSVKSASWPGRPSEQRPVKEPWHDNHKSKNNRSATRIPPVPLSNLEGSGMISPALAGISGLLMSAAGLPVCLSIPTKSVFSPPPVKKKDIRQVPGIQGSSRKVSNKKVKKPAEMVKQFLQRMKSPPLEDCTLCKRTLTEGEIGRLYRCSHTFHVRCLAPLYKNGILRCPTCQTLFGTKMGSQPPGKMSFHTIPHSLPGYPDCETIRIIYHIPPGTQGPGQPHPGMKFTAPDFPLHCYLPNNKKGREVLLLLIKAWECRILFPVHPSRVPGVPDSVSISRIPHKTEFGSNITGKGFPDSRYLDSVLRQLKDWGVGGD